MTRARTDITGSPRTRVPGCSVPWTRLDAPQTTTDQRVVAVGLTAKVTTYRLYERVHLQTHVDLLQTLTSTDGRQPMAEDGRLRSLKTVRR
jgi:hypothetical protein